MLQPLSALEPAGLVWLRYLLIVFSEISLEAFPLVSPVVWEQPAGNEGFVAPSLFEDRSRRRRRLPLRITVSLSQGVYVSLIGAVTNIPVAVHQSLGGKMISIGGSAEMETAKS